MGAVLLFLAHARRHPIMPTCVPPPRTQYSLHMECFVRCFLAYTFTNKAIADYAKTLVPGRQVGLGISQGFYDDCKRLAIVVSRYVSLPPYLPPSQRPMPFLS